MARGGIFDEAQKSQLCFRKQQDGKKEETVLQRSCRDMATQRCNLSVVRIDLNALDLQRREAISKENVKGFL